jgi:hypothetical protein
MRTDGSELEEHVRFVYDTLLGLKGEQVVVTRGATLQGKSGGNYKVDVFYEFVRAGIRHRVVIECKDTARPIERDEVLAFNGKVKDIAQVVGVMVSRSGYQPGAKSYGEHERLLLLTADQLPTIGMLLATRIEASTMPDESCVGEPFWTLMEARDGRLTGSYFSTRDASGIDRVALFIARKHAEDLLNLNAYKKSYLVRGLPQRVLRGMLIIARSQRAEAVIFYDVVDFTSHKYIARLMSLKEVEDLYLQKEFHVIDEVDRRRDEIRRRFKT